MCGTMSAFIDFAAEESGDDDNLDHQPDEEPANVAGYDTSDGFVVVDEEHDLEVANRRTAVRRADTELGCLLADSRPAREGVGVGLS